jgi:aminopeptidase YwaD
MRMRDGLFSLAVVLLSACSSPSEKTLKSLRDRIESGPPPSLTAGHTGPGVAAAGTGTGRFVRFLLPAFRRDRAMATATFADRYYREPGNEGFEAVIDHVRAELAKAGYGKRDPLRLEVIETPMSSKAWTPRRGSVVLKIAGTADRTLHEFSRPEDRDRTLLPKNAPSAKVEGPAVLGFEGARAGSIILIAEPLTKGVLQRAKDIGAAAVLSSSLAPFNVDPTPAQRHLDAIQYASVPADCPLPVAMISPRSASAVQEALAGRKAVRIALEAEVELTDRPLRTVVATVEGTLAPDDVVVLPAHVQEPGACDNASGVATLLEDARILSEMLEKGDLEIPSRSIAFVFGEEMEQSRVWLEKSGRKAIAAIAVDMTGESKKETGADPLLERMPDPGAVDPLAPDEHTAWGSSPVEASSLAPNGLSVVARCAMIDVGGMAKSWTTREHPYEGGNDHTVFIAHGVPAVLFWHFPDFAYHTSLDRMPHVDRDEMRRTGSAILATALAVADARAFDMDRYLESLAIEQDLRLAACEQAGKDSTAQLWKNWCKGARLWLADLCLARPRPNDPEKPEKSEEKP